MMWKKHTLDLVRWESGSGQVHHDRLEEKQIDHGVRSGHLVRRSVEAYGKVAWLCLTLIAGTRVVEVGHG